MREAFTRGLPIACDELTSPFRFPRSKAAFSVRLTPVPKGRWQPKEVRRASPTAGAPM